MVRKIVLSLILCAAGLAALAQKASFGIKAGANMAILDATINTDANFKLGPHIGLFGDFRLAKAISIQPEVVYSPQGWGKKYHKNDLHPGGRISTNLNYLNIPLIVKVYLGNVFYLQAGPQLGFLLSARAKNPVDTVNVNANVKQYYKSSDVSLSVGLGLEISKRFSFSGRYIHGLTDLDAYPRTQAIRQRLNLKPLTNRVFQFSFGIKLGKVRKETNVTDQ